LGEWYGARPDAAELRSICLAQPRHRFGGGAPRSGGVPVCSSPATAAQPRACSTLASSSTPPCSSSAGEGGGGGGAVGKADGESGGGESGASSSSSLDEADELDEMIGRGEEELWATMAAQQADGGALNRTQRQERPIATRFDSPCCSVEMAGLFK